jgi:hypothetical protein
MLKITSLETFILNVPVTSTAGVRADHEIVVLGDGAAWIDEPVAELFP